MNDVVLGAGSLAGRGVYAARDFAAGEVVVSYRLLPLTEAEFLALPPGEDVFVHSYGGRRFLYPEPARYVNHSDRPSCYQDFDAACDVALRPIARGEAVTIDAGRETERELETFLGAYRQARDAASLGELVDRSAVLWLSGRSVRGREAVVAALLDRTAVVLPEVRWWIGTGRWEAVCSAGAGGRGHVTMLLRVVRGTWQLVYQHVG